jgi:hypothetical protein
MTPSFPLAASIPDVFRVFGADFWLLAIFKPFPYEKMKCEANGYVLVSEPLLQLLAAEWGIRAIRWIILIGR